MFSAIGRLSALEKQLNVLKGQMDTLPTTLTALNEALKASSGSLERIDALVAISAENSAAITGIQSDITAQVDAATAPLNAQVESINTQVTSIGSKVTSDLASFQTTLTSTVNNLKTTTAADITKLQADTATALKSGGSTTVYYNWNRKECNVMNGFKPTTMYEGTTWGSYHDHHGGSTILCLKRNENNGRNSEHDSNDQLYPLSTDHCGNYANIGRCNRIISCAMCKIEKHCYDNWGSESCVNGYKPVYFGYTYGAFYNRNANGERICLDRQQTIGVDDHGHGAMLYPTVNRAYSGRSRRSVPCSKCCKA